MSQSHTNSSKATNNIDNSTKTVFKAQKGTLAYYKTAVKVLDNYNGSNFQELVNGGTDLIFFKQLISFDKFLEIYIAKEDFVTAKKYYDKFQELKGPLKAYLDERKAICERAREEYIYNKTKLEAIKLKYIDSPEYKSLEKTSAPVDKKENFKHLSENPWDKFRISQQQIGKSLIDQAQNALEYNQEQMGKFGLYVKKNIAIFTSQNSLVSKVAQRGKTIEIGLKASIIKKPLIKDEGGIGEPVSTIFVEDANRATQKPNTANDNSVNLSELSTPALTEQIATKHRATLGEAPPYDLKEALQKTNEPPQFDTIQYLSSLTRSDEFLSSYNATLLTRKLLTLFKAIDSETLATVPSLTIEPIMDWFEELAQSETDPTLTDYIIKVSELLVEQYTQNLKNPPPELLGGFQEILRLMKTPYLGEDQSNKAISEAGAVSSEGNMVVTTDSNASATIHQVIHRSPQDAYTNEEASVSKKHHHKKFNEKQVQGKSKISEWRPEKKVNQQEFTATTKAIVANVGQSQSSNPTYSHSYPQKILQDKFEEFKNVPSLNSDIHASTNVTGQAVALQEVTDSPKQRLNQVTETPTIEDATHLTAEPAQSFSGENCLTAEDAPTDTKSKNAKKKARYKANKAQNAAEAEKASKDEQQATSSQTVKDKIEASPKATSLNGNSNNTSDVTTQEVSTKNVTDNKEQIPNQDTVTSAIEDASHTTHEPAPSVSEVSQEIWEVRIVKESSSLGKTYISKNKEEILVLAACDIEPHILAKLSKILIEGTREELIKGVSEVSEVDKGKFKDWLFHNIRAIHDKNSETYYFNPLELHTTVMTVVNILDYLTYYDDNPFTPVEGNRIRSLIGKINDFAASDKTILDYCEKIADILSEFSTRKSSSSLMDLSRSKFQDRAGDFDQTSANRDPYREALMTRFQDWVRDFYKAHDKLDKFKEHISRVVKYHLPDLEASKNTAAANYVVSAESGAIDLKDDTLQEHTIGSGASKLGARATEEDPLKLMGDAE